MARITAYRYDGTVNPPTVIFTCTTPSWSGQSPFENFSSTDCEVLVMQPDPFDSRGVYPIYNTGAGRPTPDTSVPSYALYPLLISGGPDRAKGIEDDANARQRVDFAMPIRHPNRPDSMPDTVLSSLRLQPNLWSDAWFRPEG